MDRQKSMGDRLLEQYEEEKLVQAELEDIRKMNKQKYLEQKAVMSDERKVWYSFKFRYNYEFVRNIDVVMKLFKE